MNKNAGNLKKELIKRDKVFFNGNITVEKNNTVVRDGVEVENENEFVLLLKISTNTKSPVQKSFGGTWDEIIDRDCFDESLNDDLFCFLDHKIGIEHALASTRNNTMQVYKTDNAYIAKVILNRNNEEHKKVIEKVESGIVNSNSFIFQPKDTEYRENSAESEADITVVHKKGKLLSVDPVIMPFYPTNTIEFSKRSDTMENEKRQEEEVTQDAPLNELAEAEKENAAYWKAKYEKLLQEKETQKETEGDDAKPQTETEPQSKEPSGEKADIENDKEEEKEEQRNEETKILEQRNEIKERIKNMSNTQKRTYTFSELEKKVIAPSYEGYKNRAVLFNEDEKESLTERISKWENENPNLYKEVNLIASGNITRASIDGSTNDQGLAFISYINDPDVKTQLEKVLPEIEGAEGIALDTLDVVKKDLLIPNSGAIGSIAEGAAATEFNGTTVSIALYPTRYAQEYSVNPKIPNYAQIMEKNTLNGKSATIAALRKTFYTNLFKRKDTNWAQAKANYDGGFTKEALVQIAQATTLSLADIDVIISNLEAEYGDNVQGRFRMFMHPNTKTFLMKEARDAKNPDWIIEKNQMAYRGIDITTSTAYPYQVNAVTGQGQDGEIPIVIARKDCIVYRGLTFVIEDNPYIKMSNGLATRYQTTRGEVKMIDPFLNTKALKFGAIARAAEIKEEDLNAYDTSEMLKAAYDYDSLDKKSKKLYDAKLNELEKENK